MKLFTSLPDENMSDGDIYDYLVQISKMLFELTKKVNMMEKKLNDIKNG